MKPEVKPIHRIQQNFLARGERRLLNRLCAAMPSWVKPDHLTTLGLTGSAIIFAGYVASSISLSWLWLAVAGYFINWAGDSLDGSLARFRQIERPRFGYFVDHSADAFGTMMIVGGIGATPFVRMDVALLALLGYYLLSIHAFLAVRVLGEMKLSYAAAGPTELRILLIGLTIAMYAVGHPVPHIGGYAAFDLLFGLGGGVLIALFVAQTVTTARRIAAQGE